MNWEPRGKGIVNLIKLKSGESVKGIFRGDPYQFKQHWKNGRGYPCQGMDCLLCKEVDEEGKPRYPNFRFRVNFIISENGQWVAKVFEQGGRVYDKVEALSTEYALDKIQVKITRYGTDKSNTNYEIVPLPRGEVTPEMEKKISEVKLNDLNPYQATSETPDANEDEPF